MIGNMQSPFLWGSKGRKLTPDQVERERERAAAMLEGVGDTSPVQHWLQGAGRVVNAITGKIQDRRADSSEALGMESADNWIANNPVLSSLIGGGGSGVSMGVPQGVGQPLDAMQPPPSPNQEVANDAMAAIAPSEGNADWLRYKNQGATRNKPINEQLTTALSFLPEMGITMDVISGGQDAKGEGTRRTGSTRHDHGGAADVDFYKDGRKLDWNNPGDQPIFSEIVQRARANGVTGIGAGDDYMGAGRMHLGFGGDSVWGAGGKGENAPGWLRAAYNGAPAGQQAPQQATQAGYTPQQAGGAPQMDNSVISALSGAMSDPWVAKKYGPVIQALMGSQMKRQDMQYEQQLGQQDPMYQAKLDALRNPKPDALPASVQEYEYAKQNGFAGSFEQWKSSGGGGGLPASIQEAQWRAQEAGLTPGTPEYQQFMLNGGGDPATFRALDMQAQAAGLAKGTPEYAEFMATRGAGLSAGAAQTAKNRAEAATGADAAYAGTAGDLQAKTELGGEAARVAAAGSAQGTAEAADKVSLDTMQRNMPGLMAVADKLGALSETAAYGRVAVGKDDLSRALGGEVSEGGVARAEYIAIVDNEILPMLKQTFGAAFTEEEGARLRATLGDENATPAEKQATLKAFIESKIRQIEALGGAIPAAPERGGLLPTDEQTSPTGQWPKAPPVGTVTEGHTYIGGDPSKQTSWRKN